MLRLGVNIDHVATLRQARGTPYPSVQAAAEACRRAGAHGITVHLREDRRHIQDSDVYALRRGSALPLNLEMAVSEEILRIALDVKPDEVCLVPERRAELTTEGGLDVAGQADAVGAAVSRLGGAGIVASLFVDPDPLQIEAAAEAGAPCVELHTGPYCEASGAETVRAEVERLIQCARMAHSFGIQVNAGHGLNVGNLDGLFRVPHLHTLNIGHSIVSTAVFAGLENAVREVLDCLARYDGGEAQGSARAP